MARTQGNRVFAAFLLFAGGCAHVEPLAPAAADVAIQSPLNGVDAPRGCTALGDVRGVEDEALPHDERVASALNALRNEAARRGATRVTRVTVELSETPDGPPQAVAYGLAYRCAAPESRPGARKDR